MRAQKVFSHKINNYAHNLSDNMSDYAHNVSNYDQNYVHRVSIIKLYERWYT